jgi:hypothetical protein
VDIQHYAMQTIIFLAFYQQLVCWVFHPTGKLARLPLTRMFRTVSAKNRPTSPSRKALPGILSLRFQDLREASETREAEQKHQHQLEKALQDAEIRAQKEHRSWHRERQRCEKLQEELKISTSEAAEATAKVGENTDRFTKKEMGA